MTLNNLEQYVVKSFRAGRGVSEVVENGSDKLLELSLFIVMSAGKVIREARLFPDELDITYKEDGSPTTNVDIFVEEMAKNIFKEICPDIIFSGEELGGNISEEESAAMDPVDSSLNLLSHSQNNSISFALFEKKKAILGIVANPSTGEIFYAKGSDPTRLIQLSIFGESDSARFLPSLNPQEGNKILVDLQSSRDDKYGMLLRNAWNDRQISHLKSTSGSPSLGLAEAAKGHYLYVHPWGGSPTTAFDIAAGVKIIENAGGSVSGVDDPIGHQGLFIAGINEGHQNIIAKILSQK